MSLTRNFDGIDGRDFVRDRFKALNNKKNDFIRIVDTFTYSPNRLYKAITG